MRFNDLHSSVLDLDAEGQLSLPFAEHPAPQDRTPVTRRRLLDFGGRRSRTYELVVHQDPVSENVLTYCLRQVTEH